MLAVGAGMVGAAARLLGVAPRNAPAIKARQAVRRDPDRPEEVGQSVKGLVVHRVDPP